MPQNLPKSILEKASKSGSEYAWKLHDVLDIVLASEKEGFAILGGQAQFRFPDATCEMYWIKADPEDKTEKEDWDKYVHRSTSEFINIFESQVIKIDFFNEASEWPLIADKIKKGVNILDYLYFVIYFSSKEDYKNKH